MKSVKVIFENSKYNYTTSVSDAATEKTAREYFIGKLINVGVYPKELLKRCKDIVFYNS